ncbi:hypothetical protein GH733_016078 [Mirounga leonina]|nr:hypothetical protein GH733_016078 [Mirounga leonina]
MARARLGRGARTAGARRAAEPLQRTPSGARAAAVSGAANFRISTFGAAATAGEGPASELPRRRARPATRRPARHAGSGGREATARSGRGGPDLRQKRRGRRAPRPPSQAGNSICPEPRGCQRLRAGAGTRCPPAPRARRGRATSPARARAGPSEGLLGDDPSGYLEVHEEDCPGEDALIVVGIRPPISGIAIPIFLSQSTLTGHE